MKKISRLVCSCILLTGFFNSVYAVRTGPTRQEARQAKRIAVEHESREAVSEASFVMPARLDLTKNKCACLLFTLMVLAPVEARILDGTLVSWAEKVERLHELEREYPITTEAVSTGANIGANCIEGGIVGFCTAGPAGILPGCGVGAIGGATQVVQGKVISKVIGDKIEPYVDKCAALGGRGLMALDAHLTEPHAHELSRFIIDKVITGFQHASFAKGMHKAGIPMSKFDFRGIGQDFKQAPLKNVYDNLHFSEGVKSGFANTINDAFGELPAPLSPGVSDFQVPSFSLQFQKMAEKPESFLSETPNYWLQKMYQISKEESQGLHLPAIEPFDGHLNTFKGVGSHAPGVQRADMAAFNERMHQANLAKMDSMAGFVPIPADYLECRNLVKRVTDNKKFFESRVAAAKSIKHLIGEIPFPSYSKLKKSGIQCWETLLDYDHTDDEIERNNKAVSATLKGFLAEFDRQINEYNERVDELQELQKHQNIKPVVAFLEHVDNPLEYVRNALRAFSKKTPDEFFALSKKDRRDAMLNLTYAKTMLDNVQSDREFSCDPIRVDTKKMTAEILAFFRGNPRSIEVARSLLLAYCNGKFDKKIIQQARDALTSFRKGALSPVEFASAVATINAQALHTVGDYEYMLSEVGELDTSFLTRIAMQATPIKAHKHHSKEKKLDLLHDTGPIVICAPKGPCGIVNEWVSLVAVTKSNIEKAHTWFIHQYPIATAQDLLSFIMPGGELIGESCRESMEKGGAHSPMVTIIDGGIEEAQAMFKFFAQDHTVKRLYDPEIGQTAQKLVLADKTTIIFAPADSSGRAVIIIRDIPQWISQDTIQLRFEESAELRMAKKIEQISKERQKILKELVQEYDALPEVDKQAIQKIYADVMSFDNEESKK